MVGSFSFAFNKLLITGESSLLGIEKYMPISHGRLALICAPSFLNSERGEKYRNLLKDSGFEMKEYSVHGEPDPDTVDGISGELGDFNPEVIVSVGGGSVMDAGKAVSAMVPINGRVEEYLEGVGIRKPPGKKIPFIAVPTTSGTGSEATMNGVICRKGPSGFKKSLRHPAYIPDAAILDPELTASCPGSVTAVCGMDAFSQLLESFVSSRANPYSDLISLDGLKRFLASFDPLMEDPGNRDLRSEIALASYYSGLTLANVGLGVVHGLAGPMGGFSTIPHGNACGTLLHKAFRMTVEKIDKEKNETGGNPDPVISRLGELGSFIQGEELSADEGCERLLAKLEEWTRKYEIPRLSAFGITREDLDKIVDAGSNKNHPVPFSRDEMIELLADRL